MNELILYAILGILIVVHTCSISLGLRMITDDHKLLFALRRKALLIEGRYAYGKYITKPLITCCPCMASFWGLLVTGYVVRITEVPVTLPLVVTAGTSILLSSFINGYFWGLVTLTGLKGKRISNELQQSGSDCR